jgi:membrane-associated phospholipid phosphatase
MRKHLVSVFATASAIYIAPVHSADAKTHSGFRGYGDVAQYAIPALAAGGALIDGDYEGLKQFAASGATTFVVTQGLNAVVHEERPRGGGNHSFPSGHTAAAFAGASFVHYRYGWEWGIPFELAAAAVGVSRIESHEHHWQDVVGSALIAHAASFVFVDPKDSTVTLLPFMDLRKPTFGIIASIHF